MKKSKSLKDFEWKVIINQREVGFPNFYWEATCEKFKITSYTVYNSKYHAKGAWKEFAHAEGITKFL